MSASPAQAAAVRLRRALDAAAAALAQPDLDGLLAAESALTATFADLSFLRTLARPECASVRDELLAAQTALRRARRLGASLSDFVAISLQAHGQTAGYDPAPTTAAALSGRGFHARA